MIESVVQAPHTEGPVAKNIEQQTSRLPSDLFLWAAVGAIAVSAAMQVAHRRDQSIFFGQWVPTFLLLGVYNKIVKVAGHDRVDRPSPWVPE